MESVLKLLIVDDETRFLKTIARRLRLRGLDVSTASNGPDAIALARGREFDVALLDLKMPGMDGSQVHRALKEVDPLIETIILTGHGSLRGAVELSRLGAFGYLPKPYELDKLLDALAHAFAQRLRNMHAGQPEIVERIDGLGQVEDPLERLRQLATLDGGR